jgi:hypothetical protein
MHDERRHAHERQQADHRTEEPPHSLYHQIAPFLWSSGRAIPEDRSTQWPTLFVSRHQAGGIGRRVDRGVEIDQFSGFSDALLVFFAGLEEI